RPAGGDDRLAVGARLLARTRGVPDRGQRHRRARARGVASRGRRGSARRDGRIGARPRGRAVVAQRGAAGRGDLRAPDEWSRAAAVSEAGKAPRDGGGSRRETRDGVNGAASAAARTRTSGEAALSARTAAETVSFSVVVPAHNAAATIGQ